MNEAKAYEGVNGAEWMETKKSSPVGVPKHSRAIFSKVGFQSRITFPIIPQLQCMVYHFLALTLWTQCHLIDESRWKS
jgi:hypothetical protein